MSQGHTVCAEIFGLTLLSTTARVSICTESTPITEPQWPWGDVYGMAGTPRWLSAHLDTCMFKSTHVNRYLARYELGHSYIRTGASMKTSRLTRLRRCSTLVVWSTFHPFRTVMQDQLSCSHMCINKGFTAWGQGGMCEWMSFRRLAPIYASAETQGIEIFHIQYVLKWKS